MSTEARLARLGLLHLQDQPEKLQAELERRSAEYDKSVAAWHRSRARTAIGICGTSQVAEAFEKAYDAKWAEVLELVAARLREEGFDADVDGTFVGLGEDVDRRAALEHATALPYTLRGMLFFLPLGLADEMNRAPELSWRGAAAGSTLRLLGPVEFPASGQPRATVVGGETSIVFPDPPALFAFLAAPDTPFLVRAALDAAFQRQERFSFTKIRLHLLQPTADWRAELAALPASLTRTISFERRTLELASVGDHDALVVQSDQLKEHFAARALSITDVIAEPGEAPDAALARIA